MRVLAINPWIYDFAAYDFWLKPYGFLVILEYLKNQGIKIDYLDCLGEKEKVENFGRGKYHAQIIEKPTRFNHIPRHYKRYGIFLETFRQKLPRQNPDYVLITSSMTYWYPGIIETVKIIREQFPQSKIILGGTYATLCFDHAVKTCGCDYVFSNKNIADFFNLLKIKYDSQCLYQTLPDYQFYYPRLDYVVFRSSWGCPFNCSYCAIKELFPGSLRINSEKILQFIFNYVGQGIKDFVLYDDAFLFDQDYAKNLLTAIVKKNLGLRFHTPNALHLRFIDRELAELLKQCGFINPHFGLETVDQDLQKNWGDKVTRSDLLKAIEYLKQGGYKPGEFSAYLLLGYPGQDLNQLKTDVDFLHNCGMKTSFAEFSPVPGTRLFQQYSGKFDDPLLQNNSVFGSFQEGKIKEFWEIKNYLRQLNKSF
jgi:radical SAM superfamily enzyme YgiQ (UPF0313 family)